MTRRLLAALLALPLLAACGAGAAPGPSQSTDAAPTGDYVSDGLPHPFEEGDVLRVTFGDGEIRFQATCNTMSGLASWEHDVLRVSQLGGTEMGCPGAGHEQDEWLVDFFTPRPTFETFDVGFAFMHEGTTLRLLPPEAASDEDVRIGSVDWQLTGIEETDGESVSMTAVPEASSASLDITGTRFVMETGCNTASAIADLGDGAVQIKEMLVTERGCRVGWLDAERLQLAALDGDVTWSIDGDQLRLGNDRVVLLYAPRR